MAAPAGDTTVYVAGKTGTVVALRGGRVDPVLDLSGQVSGGSEEGLLGVAVSPDRAFLYVDYTDLSANTRVAEYALRDGRADPSTRREVLFVHQPYINHNGGELTFGPDGNLWIGLGDGGSEGDPQGYAQNLGVLLGKLLRISPRPSGGQPYGVPPDNPFVGRAGTRPEIWDFGLRNPWRFSFDRATHDLWIGDVGGSQREEVDYEPAGRGGRNYGWNRMEGSVPFKGGPAPGLVPPILDYSHSGGACVVTGGYVYRGARIPALRGAYLYGDFCTGRIEAVRQSGGRVVERARLPLQASQLSSFGEDQAGELYVLSLDGTVARVDPA
ncbi:MAG: PQQ-dependent sugar dehydrogenase [Actinobacteria bacterium]|nr:MAG: PQQ-dependent sugar dehydrogenase [Actinomycetota bacterium]